MLGKVTVLAYYFRSLKDDGVEFRPLSHAIRETWKHCGRLNTVLVVNEKLPSVVAFAAKFTGTKRKSRTAPSSGTGRVRNV